METEAQSEWGMRSQGNTALCGVALRNVKGAYIDKAFPGLYNIDIPRKEK